MPVVPQLVGDIPEVHVHRYGPKFHGAVEGLNPFRTVHGVDPDPVPAAHPQRGEVVGETGGAFVEFAVRDGPGVGDERFTVGNRVRHQFDDVSELERAGHGFSLSVSPHPSNRSAKP
jgi:hypothetical protein